MGLALAVSEREREREKVSTSEHGARTKSRASLERRGSNEFQENRRHKLDNMGESHLFKRELGGGELKVARLPFVCCPAAKNLVDIQHTSQDHLS